MVSRERYFARVPYYLDVERLQGQRVVIVGLGMVGSPIATELARCTVGHLCFIDHEPLEEENLSRHVLTADFLRWNKAEAMAVYLRDQIDGLKTEAIPRKIDNSVLTEQLDTWLSGADLVIAATDDRAAQRRVMQSALALDIPALAPALYVPHGGEVIVVPLKAPTYACSSISDATCTILKPRLIKYTQGIATRHGLPTELHKLYAATFDQQRRRQEPPKRLACSFRMWVQGGSRCLLSPTPPDRLWNFLQRSKTMKEVDNNK